MDVGAGSQPPPLYETTAPSLLWELSRKMTYGVLEASKASWMSLEVPGEKPAAPTSAHLGRAGGGMAGRHRAVTFFVSGHVTYET